MKDYLYDLFIEEAIPALSRHSGGSGGSGGGGGGALNIHYGEEAPSNKSALWCKCEEPTNVLAKAAAKYDGVETVRIADTCLLKGQAQHSAVVVGNKIYLFGGRDTSGTKNSSIFVFDPESATVSQLNGVSTRSAYGMMSAAIGNKVYLFGGYDGSGMSGYSTAISVLDLETNTHTTLSETTKGYASFSGVGVVGTKVYLFGGTAGNYGNDNSIEVFDSETKTSRTCTTKLSNDSYNIGVGVVGDKIYLFGGKMGRSSSGYSYLDTIQVFDIETESITTLSVTLPVTLSSMSTSVVGSKIYLFGGYNGSSYSDAIYVFDIETETVSELQTKLPTPVISATSGTIGTVTYVLGGQSDSNTYLNTIHVFNLEFDLEPDTMLLQTSFLDNKFEIVNGIEMGVKNVYRGNVDGKAERVEAYTYQDDAWVQI